MSIIPVWVVMFTASLSVMNKYSPVWRMEIFGGGWEVGLRGAIAVPRFSIRFWPWRDPTLVLYQKTCGILIEMPPYLFYVGYRGSVSSGMMWGA